MSLSGVRTPQPPPPSSYLFHSETLLPLALPISQHSWAMPYQSKGQFMGLMLQRVQTGLWDRMFGWYLALLKQTSHQNMITEGRGNTFLVLLQCAQAMLMSTKYHCLYLFPHVWRQSLMTTRQPNVWHSWHNISRTLMASGKRLARTPLTPWHCPSVRGNKKQRLLHAYLWVVWKIWRSWKDENKKQSPQLHRQSHEAAMLCTEYFKSFENGFHLQVVDILCRRWRSKHLKSNAYIMFQYLSLKGGRKFN